MPHPEPGDGGGHLGQFGLELLGPPLQFDRIAAMRAALGPRASRVRSGPAGAMRWPWRPWGVALLAPRPGRRVLRGDTPLEKGADCRLPARRDSSNSPSSSAMRASRAASASVNSASFASSAAIRFSASTLHGLTDRARIVVDTYAPRALSSR